MSRDDYPSDNDPGSEQPHANEPEAADRAEAESLVVHWLQTIPVDDRPHPMTHAPLRDRIARALANARPSAPPAVVQDGHMRTYNDWAVATHAQLAVMHTEERERQLAAQMEAEARRDACLESNDPVGARAESKLARAHRDAARAHMTAAENEHINARAVATREAATRAGAAT